MVKLSYIKSILILLAASSLASMVRIRLLLIVIHSFQQSDDQVIDCSDKCLAVEKLHFEGVHLEEHYEAVIGSDLLDHHSGRVALDVNLLARVESELPGDLHLADLQTDRTLQDPLHLALNGLRGIRACRGRCELIVHEGHLGVSVLNEPNEGHGLVRVLDVSQALI